MKKYKSIGKLLAVSFLTAAIASACTEDAMDKINENPNNPLDAPAKFLITDLGVNTGFSTVGGDFSLYSSVYIEHETGISTSFTVRKYVAESLQRLLLTITHGSTSTQISRTLKSLSRSAKKIPRKKEM